MSYLPLKCVDDIQDIYNETLKYEGDSIDSSRLLYDYTQNPFFATNKYNGPYKNTNKGFRNFTLQEGKDNYELISGMYMRHINSLIIHDWSYTKQIYCPDNDFLDMLLNIDSLDIYPDDVAHFPYQTFYIDLSSYSDINADGVFVKLDKIERNGETFLFVYYAAVVDGKAGLEYRFPEWIPLMVYGVDKFKDGYHLEKKDFEKSRIHPKSQRDIAHIEIGMEQTPLSVHSHNQDLSFLIIRFLLFLNIKNPDIEENKITKQTYKPFTTPKNKFSEIRKWDVGVRYGEKIRLWREQQKNSYGGRNEKSSSPRPHLRKGHFSHVWCGKKGEQYLKLVFIHELFVNGSEKDIIPKINQIETEFKDRYDGERCIAEWLDSHHIIYERQKYIPEIKKYFDFYVDGKYMIEFDGEQHFEPVEYFGGQEKFEQQQRYDKIKNQWCLDNHIPLFRIRYDEKQILPQILSRLFEKEEELER